MTPRSKKVKEYFFGVHTPKERDNEESINDGKVPLFKFSFIASICSLVSIDNSRINSTEKVMTTI